MSATYHPLAWAAGVVGGLVLATIPVLLFLPMGGHGNGHRDHAPHHGGQLGMQGDTHVEVARRHGLVLVYLSDATRRPLAPIEGTVAFDHGPARPMRVEEGRLVAPDDPTSTSVTVTVRAERGEPVVMSFAFEANAPAPTGRSRT